jgi:hypothetical protein
MQRFVWMSAVLLAAPVAAWAHPGHAAGAAGIPWVHYLTDPYHLLIGALSALCVGALAGLALRVLRACESTRS